MSTENAYRVVGAILVVSAMVMSAYYRHRAARRGKESGDEISQPREEGPVLFATRAAGGLVFWGGVLVYLVNPAWMAWSQVDLPAGLRWGGAALLALDLPLMYWMFSSLGKNITHTVATRKEHELVTWGPYRWVRHPLYAFAMLAAAGLALLAANWFVALTAAATFAVLIARTSLEEQRLVERFGDEYRRYMQRTGRFFPRI